MGDDIVKIPINPIEIPADPIKLPMLRGLQFSKFWYQGFWYKGFWKPPIVSPPGPPGVRPVCQGVDDGREPVEGDDNHHKTRDIETKDPDGTDISLAFELKWT